MRDCLVHRQRRFISRLSVATVTVFSPASRSQLETRSSNGRLDQPQTTIILRRLQARHHRPSVAAQALIRAQVTIAALTSFTFHPTEPTWQSLRKTVSFALVLNLLGF